MDARLQELESLHTRGAISQQEYESARAAALGIAPPVVLVVAKPQAKCRFGHSMEWVNHVMVATKHGQRESYGGVCVVCSRKIAHKDYFFKCMAGTEEECGNRRIVCHECGLSGAEARYPTNQRWNSSLFGCTDDVGVCLDSFVCMYCLMAQMTHVVGNRLIGLAGEGLPTDGSSPNVSCDCNHCMLVFALGLYDVAFLGGVGALLTSFMYQEADMKYSPRTEDHHDCCGSFMKGLFCRCCAIAELSREYSSRGDFLGGVYFTKVPSTLVPRRPLPPMGETEANALMAQIVSAAAAASPPPTAAPYPTVYCPQPAPYPPPPQQQQPAEGIYGR